MLWLYENWTLLVVILALIVAGAIYMKRFKELPSEEQLVKVRELLLYLVIEAEKIYGSKQGAVKLRYCYMRFCELFPSLVPLVPFDLFSKMVDSALDQMKNLLKSNEVLRKYVTG